MAELTVHEKDTYREQKKNRARSLILFCLRMQDWKPVTKDEMYVVRALFKLMGTIQKPTLRSYFSKKFYSGNYFLWQCNFYGLV